MAGCHAASHALVCFHSPPRSRPHGHRLRALTHSSACACSDSVRRVLLPSRFRDAATASAFHHGHARCSPPPPPSHTHTHTLTIALEVVVALSIHEGPKLACGVAREPHGHHEPAARRPVRARQHAFHLPFGRPFGRRESNQTTSDHLVSRHTRGQARARRLGGGGRGRALWRCSAPDVNMSRRARRGSTVWFHGPDGSAKMNFSCGERVRRDPHALHTHTHTHTHTPAPRRR